MEQIEINARLWSRVKIELEYIEKRLADPNINPKTTIVLAIMRSRLNHMIKDSEQGPPYKLDFTHIAKEVDKLE